MRALLLCAAIGGGLVACGGASTPEPETPQAEPAAQADAPDSKDGPDGKAIKLAKHQEQPSNKGLPAGVIATDISRHQSTGRLPVSPVDLALDDLPTVSVPEPLSRDKAPKELPNNKGTSDLEIEKIDSGWRSRGTHGSAVYVVLKEELGRLQIGTISDDRNASERVYRTCGDRYYNQPMLTPARWQTLSVKRGKAVYKIVDAWFDAKSCTASVVRETVVEPKPVLGSLLYAFKATCDDCLNKLTINFLAPPLGQVAANGVGGEATASHGTFTQVRLPLRRGGAASFTGQVQAHALTRWLEALDEKTLGGADAVMGAEIQHGVSDTAPVAITYATLIRR